MFHIIHLLVQSPGEPQQKEQDIHTSFPALFSLEGNLSGLKQGSSYQNHYFNIFMLFLQSMHKQIANSPNYASNCKA